MHDARTFLFPSPSLPQILNFDTLTPDQESQFLSTLVRDVGLGVAPAERSVSAETTLTDLVRVCQARKSLCGFAGCSRFTLPSLHAQEYVRSKHLWRVHVSIRDMGRVLRLYKVLMRPRMREVFLLPPPPNASPAEVGRRSYETLATSCALHILFLRRP